MHRWESVTGSIPHIITSSFKLGFVKCICVSACREEDRQKRLEEREKKRAYKLEEKIKQREAKMKRKEEKMAEKMKRRTEEKLKRHLEENKEQPSKRERLDLPQFRTTE